MVAVPSTTNPSRITKTFMLLFTKTIAPNNARIINVTTVSTCANIHEDCPFISIIFTRKSSLISLSTTNIRLATNNNTRNGMKSMNSSFRCLPFRVTRLLFCSISCAVGCGKRVKLYPKRANKGSAKAPISAGIQNSLTFNVFITNNPMDFAVPELITMLIPKRLAKISVVRRPSIKLKITPHIQPNDNPLKNMANIL